MNQEIRTQVVIKVANLERVHRSTYRIIAQIYHGGDSWDEIIQSERAGKSNNCGAA